MSATSIQHLVNENPLENVVVTEYRAREIQSGAQGLAKDAFDVQNSNLSFQLSEHAAVKAGIDKLQKQNLDQKVDEIVLERLKEIQEKAYKEAYQLGFAEGRDEAMQKAQPEIAQRLKELDAFLTQLNQLKGQILKENEAAFVKMVFAVSKRIVAREISMDPSVIVSVLEESLKALQDEAKIVLRISAEDKAYLDSVQTSEVREIFEKAKFEVDETVAKGGCIIETLNGMTDATLDERVSRTWASLESRLPKPAISEEKAE